jgi:hypothetical protein
LAPTPAEQEFPMADLAAFQVDAHGLARSVFVSIGNCKHDPLMLHMELLVIGKLAVLLTVGNNLGLGNGRYAVNSQKFGEPRIVGGLCDCNVKGEVGAADRLPGFDAGKYGGMAVEDLLFLRRRTAKSGESCRFDFERGADFEDFKDGRDPVSVN